MAGWLMAALSTPVNTPGAIADFRFQVSDFRLLR
jgi:hypothetical protein